MPSCLEFEGKNEENAVQNACEELNLTKEKIKYSVISYGSSGIFGLVGSKKARIRVTLPKHPCKDVADNYNNEKSFMAKDSPIKAMIADKEAPPISDDSVDFGREVLQTIIDVITTDAKISVGETLNPIMFNIEGGNTALLIGKHGQTLEAIQYLVEKIVNKHNKQRIRIQVDSEGYMENRRIKLEKLASRLAEKSKRNGKPVTVGQMNAHERRIVHIALKDDNGVRTQSIGEGVYKKLVIFPKKNYPQKRK